MEDAEAVDNLGMDDESGEGAANGVSRFIVVVLFTVGSSEVLLLGSMRLEKVESRYDRRRGTFTQDSFLGF